MDSEQNIELEAKPETTPDQLPVLPLRNTVLFPGIVVPITAGRKGTLKALEEAVAGHRQMIGLAQKHDAEEAKSDNLYRTGVRIRVLQTQKMPGGVQFIAQCDERIEVSNITEDGESGVMRASFEVLRRIKPENPDDIRFQALDSQLRTRAAQLGQRLGIPVDALRQLMEGIQDPGGFADFISFYLDLPTEEKQGLLAELRDEERMRATLVAIERESERLDAQREIQEKVKEELGEKQREVYLREQLKAIQGELGEDEKQEVGELREKVEALNLTGEVATEVERELDRLERIPQRSPEYQVIRGFLEWVTELPWNKRTDDSLDLEKSHEILEEDHYGLKRVKDRVLEFLSVKKLQLERSGGAKYEVDTSEIEEGALVVSQPLHEEGGLAAPESDSEDATAAKMGNGPILLFAGPPGTGKTSIAKSIARALGRKYVRIALGGARDEADIRGHRRTYIGAMPGRIIQGMRQAGTKNPVILLDEVDKLGSSFQGDPSSALLEVLDPAQNDSFTDHYLGIPFDLSEVLFVATANRVDQIPPALLDRMEMVDFSGYTEREKLEIAKRYLVPVQREANGLTEDEFQPSDEDIMRVIRNYTHEAGVRNLERKMADLARKVAREIAEGKPARQEFPPDLLRELLGRGRGRPEKRAEEATVGVATGMFYTPAGGDILFIEVGTVPGKDRLTLTGQLGDVMKESAHAALTYARLNREKFDIEKSAVEDVDIHVHVPAGAIPKDGPSAGVTIATALVSAFSGKKVKSTLAMTGEITLTGRVLPIGGIKEKVLGAHRAGITEIVLPEENEADLEELPEEVLRDLTVHAVSNLDQVLEVALLDQ